MSTTYETSRGDSLVRGSLLGRYLILEPIGQGGMGQVYAAYDPSLDRKVAIKILKRTWSDPERAETERKRLVREAQAVARLSHPNVIVVYDVGIFEGQLFVAMEWVDGVTAREWIRQKERTVRDILSVYLQAGSGLAAVHRAGLIHRDFKPHNVLCGADGRVRVLDFGLAMADRERFAARSDPSRQALRESVEESSISSGS